MHFCALVWIQHINFHLKHWHWKHTTARDFCVCWPFLDVFQWMPIKWCLWLSTLHSIRNIGCWIPVTFLDILNHSLNRVYKSHWKLHQLQSIVLKMSRATHSWKYCSESYLDSSISFQGIIPPKKTLFHQKITACTHNCCLLLIITCSSLFSFNTNSSQSTMF